VVACLDALFTPDPTKETQYRNVYRRGHMFAARFKFRGKLIFLGYFPTERQAAEAVARAYAELYGPTWFLRFRGGAANDRKRRPWQPVRWFVHQAEAPPLPPRAGGVVDGGAAEEHATGSGWVFAGWAVEVWEWGQQKVLGEHLHPRRPVLDWPHRRRPWVWPTDSAAGDGHRRWRQTAAVNRWGLLAPYALFR
jgi:hypothetical protein